MKTEMLLKDPVFQLNLLLWMTKEQPLNGCCVYPLFFHLRFEILYIEQPFSFPPETANAMKESCLDIGEAPEPDLLLHRRSDKKALYLEAKANSFGCDSSNCRQARAHLTACGPAFAEVFKPIETCLLCYVLPSEASGPMRDCLSTLRKELRSKNLQAGEFSCHGLAVRDQRIVYSWDSAFKDYVGERRKRVCVVPEVRDDTDPSPLILVFSDDDCSNPDSRDFYRQVMIDQSRARLLCDLHSLDIGLSYELTADSLLSKTTDDIFQYLGRARQKALRRLIHDRLLRRIHDYWSLRQSGVRLVDRHLTVSWATPQEKEALLDWLEDRRTVFDASKLPPEPPTLFDDLDDLENLGEDHTD